MKNHELLEPRIMGTEMEYGLICHNAKGKPIENKTVFPKLINTLPNDVRIYNNFLTNGARFYMDLNDILEVTTPECASVEDVLTYEIAGEQILFGGLSYLKKEGFLSDFRLQKRVSDEHGKFQGSHESYSTSRQTDPETSPLQDILATHLATRDIFAGAGRVSNRGFNVSQKKPAINTMSNYVAHDAAHRPLVDTRDEPLAEISKYRRIHVSAGDANILPDALRLKLGTTSLIIRMVEQGVKLSDLTLDNPLLACHLVGEDQTLTQKLPTIDGRRLTAINIQQELAERAVTMARRYALPSEEEAIIRQWRETTAQLEKDPDQLIGQVDWITKRHIVQRKTPKTNRETVVKRRYWDLNYDLLNNGTGSKIREKLIDQEKITHAMSNAPSDTRAKIRGQIIEAVTRDPELKKKISKIDWEKVDVGNVTLSLGQPNGVINKLLIKALEGIVHF